MRLIIQIILLLGLSIPMYSQGTQVKNRVELQSGILPIELSISDVYGIESGLYNPQDIYTSRKLAFRLYKEGSIQIDGASQSTTIKVSVPGEFTEKELTISSTDNAEAVYVYTIQNSLTQSFTIEIEYVSGNIGEGVYLEYGMESDRYLSPSTFLPQTVLLDVPNRIIQWTAIEGAKDYELQWVYIDSYYSGEEIETAQEAFLVKEPVNIQVSSNWYELHTKYPQGKLYYRVRPITRVFTSSGVTKDPWYGAWAYYAGFEEIDDELSEVELNWSRQTNFAEEGMQKTVVQYYDGALYGRQALTSLSTESITIVGESYYDYAGRSSIQVLPYPEMGINYMYHTLTNRIQATAPIQPEDLATEDAIVFSTASGAGEYYQGNSEDFLSNPFYALTPKADGYVGSQIRYLSDNTGRMISQSGVGETFSMGENHEISVFYETPTKEELNSMFGSHVGDAKLYEKTITVDANGQQSVQYKDGENRVVATALRGENPDNLDAIIDFTQSTRTYNIGDNASLDRSRKELTLTHEIAQSDKTPQVFSFEYGFNGAEVSFTSNYISSIPPEDCIYNVEIYITDKFTGERMNFDSEHLPEYITPVEGDPAISTYLVESSTIGVYNGFRAESVSNIGDITFSYILPMGNYIVNKKVELVTEVPLIRNSSTFEGLYRTQRGSTVKDETYAAIPKDYSGCTGSSEPTDVYEDLYEQLENPMSTDMCASLRGQMKSDFSIDSENPSLNGYFFNTAKINQQGNRDFWNTVYTLTKNGTIVFGESVNTLGTWQTMRSDIIDNYEDKEELASTLLPYHLEYCHLQMCPSKRRLMIYNTQLNLQETPPAGVTWNTYDPCVAYTGYPRDAEICDNVNVSINLASIRTEVSNTISTLVSNHEIPSSEIAKYSWILFKGKYLQAREQVLLMYYRGESDELDYPWASCGYFSESYFSAVHVRDPLVDITLEESNTRNLDQSIEMTSPIVCKELYRNQVDRIVFEMERNALQYDATYVSDEEEITAYKEAVLTQLSENYCERTQYSTSIFPEMLSMNSQGEEAPLSLQTILNQSTVETAIVSAYVRDLLDRFEDDNHFMLTDRLGTESDMVDYIMTHYYTQWHLLPYIGYEDYQTLVMPYIPEGVSITSLPIVDVDNGMSVEWSAQERKVPTSFYNQYMKILQEALRVGIENMNTVEDYGDRYKIDITTLDSYTEDFPFDRIKWGMGSWSFENSNGYYQNLDMLTTFLLNGINYTENYNKVYTVYYEIFNGLGRNSQNRRTLHWNIDGVTGEITYTFYDNNGVITSQPTIPTVETPYYRNYTGADVDKVSKDGVVYDLTKVGEYSVQTVRSIKEMASITQKTICLGTLEDIDELTATKEYFLTPFGTQLMNILKELIRKDINSINEEIIDITELESYTPGFFYDRFFVKNGSVYFTKEIYLNYSNPRYNSLIDFIFMKPYNPEICEAFASILSSSTNIVDFTWNVNTATGKPTYIFYNLQGEEEESYLFDNWANDGFFYTFGQNYLDYPTPPLTEGIAPIYNGQGLSLTWRYYDYQSIGQDCEEIVEGYTSTEFIDEYFAIYNELLQRDPLSLDNYTCSADLQWSADLTNLASYIPSFPFKEVRVASNGAYLRNGLGNSYISIIEYFDLNATVGPAYLNRILRELLADVTVVGERLKWYVNPTTGHITVQVYDSEGTIISFNGVSEFELVPLTQCVLKSTDQTCEDLVSIEGVTCSGTEMCLSAVRSVNKCKKGCIPYPDPFVEKINPLVIEQRCIEYKNDVYEYNSERESRNVITEQLSRFNRQYRLQGFTGTYSEHFRYTTTNPEYYYTLYYYDKSSNLIQTVPPSGVTLVPSSSITYQRITVPYVEADSEDGTYIASSPRVNYDFYYTGAEPQHRLASMYAYNGLNQPLATKVPDQDYPNQFVYNDLSMLRFSKSSRHYDNEGYNFMTYDALGRVVSSGEMATGTWNIVLLQQNANTNSIYRANSLLSPTSAVYTTYDIPNVFMYGLPNSFRQDATTLRNRVSATAVVEGGRQKLTTYYNYDAHGNVSSLMHSYEELYQETEYYGSPEYEYGDPTPYKTVDYEYDLLSNKVTKVMYQKGQPDEFTHKYSYDADNRLRDVYTSSNGYTWEHDARYFYYAHGPLARVEYGTNKVQGVDYVYTLQGWLKGVNSQSLLTQDDAGRDYEAIQGNKTGNVNQDVYGYTLHYYSENNGTAITKRDYTPVLSTWNQGTISNQLEMDARYRPLYNGNIAMMTTNLLYSQEAQNITGSQSAGIGALQKSRMVNYYTYDQLQRITSMQSVFPESGTVSMGAYGEQYEYDFNGNITSLTRNGSQGTVIDALDYKYLTDENDPTLLLSNRLLDVADASVSSLGFAGNKTALDANNQYSYDADGNLTGDAIEGVTITWNATGKVSSVTKTDGTYMKFSYDGMGNRMSKVVKPAGMADASYELYTRDASGNIMATYRGQIVDYNIQNAVEDVIVNVEDTYIYGSSRIGVNRNGDRSKVNRAHIQYELTNHLGNVLVVVTGNKLEDAGGNYIPDIVSTSDYTPFGMSMEGRTFESTDYKYGFNGKIKEDEFYGEGNAYDFGARIYDARLGRMFSIDRFSKDFPSESNYIFAGNSPIYMIDINGDFKWPEGEEGRRLAEAYPIAYTYIMSLDVSKGQSILSLMNSPTIVNAMLNNVGGNLALNPSNVGVETTFTGSNFTLNKDELKTAYTPGSGPQFEFTMTPGDKYDILKVPNKDAGAYNPSNEGKIYNAPIQLNEQMLANIQNATTELDRQAGLLILSTTIMHDYLEYFAPNDSNTYDKWINNEPVTQYWGPTEASFQIYNYLDPVYSSGMGTAQQVIQTNTNQSTIPIVPTTLLAPPK